MAALRLLATQREQAAVEAVPGSVPTSGAMPQVVGARTVRRRRDGRRLIPVVAGSVLAAAVLGAAATAAIRGFGSAAGELGR